MKRYAITAINTEGKEQNIFKDGKTYKRKAAAENLMFRMEEIFVDSSLEVKEVELGVCPHCGAQETKFYKFD